MIIKRYLHHRSICMVLALCLTLLLVGCTAKSQTAESQTADYGVFLSVTEDLSALRDYKTVVIDAQYFSGAEIEAFRADGHTVYSYLNVGSLENFRDYYATYAPLTLGAYEHWDEERWIDVADQRWQRFLTETLIPALLEKHIDGFLIDSGEHVLPLPAACAVSVQINVPAVDENCFSCAYQSMQNCA